MTSKLLRDKTYRIINETIKHASDVNSGVVGS